MSRLPQRAVGTLAAALCLAVSTGASAQAGSTVSVHTVTSGATRSLGEPAAAQDTSASAVTATVFNATGPLATVWTTRAGTTTWNQVGSVLPAGFGSSYDPAAAAAPGGPLLVVAGTAPPGEKCITNGSVAIANVDSHGRLGAARLVSDQRGTGSFDDRPTVAVGQHGIVWVAWSQGPDSNACQDVGSGDRIEVAVSHNGGQTFGAPITMPADGGHSAFGVRLAPLSGGRLAASWTETMSNGDQAVFVTVLGPTGQLGQLQQVLTGDRPPLTLPGASFYDFPAGDMIALADGRLAVIAPFWVPDESVLKVAVGMPGGQWRQTVLRPPAGADLLLPALGQLSSGDLRVLCAVHTRAGDHLGYDWADLSVTGQGLTVGSAGLTALTPAPAGPGFYEIGEELSLAPTPDGLLTAVVVAGKDGATLEAAAFKAPAPTATPSKSGTTATPGSGSSAPAAGTGAGAGATPGSSASSTGVAQASNGSWFASSTIAIWLAVLALCAAAIFLGLRLRRRRRTTPWQGTPNRRAPSWDAPNWNPPNWNPPGRGTPNRGGGPGRGNPGWDAPNRGGGPGRGNPGWGAPGQATPGWSPPGPGWSPPERGAPGYGAPGWSPPGRGTPGRGTPGRGTPAPGWGPPERNAPGHGAPGYGAPGRGTPNRGAPGRVPPGRVPPGRGTPGRVPPGRGAPERGAPERGAPGQDRPRDRPGQDTRHYPADRRTW